MEKPIEKSTVRARILSNSRASMPTTADAYDVSRNAVKDIVNYKPVAENNYETPEKTPVVENTTGPKPMPKAGEGPSLGDIATGLGNFLSGAWRTLNDARLALLEDSDAADANALRGEVMYKDLPKLKESQIQLKYLTTAQAFDAKIREANRKPAELRDVELKALYSQRDKALSDIRNVDEFHKLAVQNVYNTDAFKSQEGMSSTIANVAQIAAQTDAAIKEKNKATQDYVNAKNDRDVISDYYKQKEAITPMEWDNPESYAFRLPRLLGSSYSSMKRSAPLQLASAATLFLGNAALAAASTAMTPATGGLSTTAASTYASAAIASASMGIGIYDSMARRNEESLMEAYSSYKDRITSEVSKKYDLDELRDGARQSLKAIGKDPSKLNDDEVMDLMLTTNLQSGNKDFENDKLKYRKELAPLILQNQMLSGIDIAENAMNLPMIGMASKNILKASKKIAGLKQIVNAGEKVAKAVSGTAGKVLDNAVIRAGERVLDATGRALVDAPVLGTALKKTVLSTNGQTIGKFVGSTIKRAAANAILEGAEEGTQWQFSEDYKKGKYNENYTFLDTMKDYVGDNINAVKTAMGFSTNPAMDSSKDYQENVAGGMLMGLAMSIFPGAIKPSYDMVKQVRVNNIMREATADDIKSKEDMVKAKTYATKALQGKQDQVLNTLQMMKKLRIDGLTDEDLDAEIERAKKTMTYANSSTAKNIAKAANIDIDSDKFKTLVALATNASDIYNNEKAANETLHKGISDIFNSEDAKSTIENIKNKALTGLGIELDNGVISRLIELNQNEKALRATIDMVNTQKEAFEEANIANGTSLNSDKLDEYSKRLEAKLKADKKAKSEFLSTLADSYTTEDESTVDTTLLNNLFESVDDLSGVTNKDGMSLSQLMQTKHLSELSLNDALNRYNAYNGAFFDNESAMQDIRVRANKRGVTTFNPNTKSVKAIVKDMNILQKRDLFAGMLAKDEINHYLESLAYDQSIDNELGSYPTEQDTTDDITNIKVEPTVSPVMEDPEVAQLKSDYEILKNAYDRPGNKIKDLPKHLKKEAKKKGMKKALEDAEDTYYRTVAKKEHTRLRKEQEADSKRISSPDDASRAEGLKTRHNAIGELLQLLSSGRTVDGINPGSDKARSLFKEYADLNKEHQRLTGKELPSIIFDKPSQALSDLHDAKKNLNDIRKQKDSKINTEIIDGETHVTNTKEELDAINKEFDQQLKDAEEAVNKAKKAFDDAKRTVKPVVAPREDNIDKPEVQQEPKEIPTESVVEPKQEEVKKPTPKVAPAHSPDVKQVLAKIEADRANYTNDSGDTKRTEDGRYYLITEEDGKEYQYLRTTSVLGYDEKGNSLSWEGGKLGAPASEASTNATTIGTNVDRVIRDFFMNAEYTKVHGITEEAHRTLLASLRKIKENMDSTGETFLTNNVVVYGTFEGLDSNGKTVIRRIAGEMDILAVDKDGNFRIYDIKTSKYSFEPVIKKLANGDIHVNDHFNEVGGNILRSARKGYSLQLSAYKNMFENMYDVPVLGLGILPFHVKGQGANAIAIKRQNSIVLDYDADVEKFIPRAVLPIPVPEDAKPLISIAVPVGEGDGKYEGPIKGYGATPNPKHTGTPSDIDFIPPVTEEDMPAAPDEFNDSPANDELDFNEADAMAAANALNAIKNAQKPAPLAPVVEEPKTAPVTPVNVAPVTPTEPAAPVSKVEEDNTPYTPEECMDKLISVLNSGQKNEAMDAGAMPDVTVNDTKGKDTVMMWYSPSSETPLTIDGYSPRSGKELNELLNRNPDALLEFDSEIVVRDWNGTPAIYIVFTGKYKKDMQYAMALRDNVKLTKTDAAKVTALKDKILSAHANLKDGERIVPTGLFVATSRYDNQVDPKTGAPIFRSFNQVKGFGFSNDFTLIGKTDIISDKRTFGVGRGARYDMKIMDQTGATLPGTGGSGNVYFYPNGGTRPVQLRPKDFKTETNARAIGELVYKLMVEKRFVGDSYATINKNGKEYELPFKNAELLKLIVHTGAKTILVNEDKENFGFLLEKQLYFNKEKGTITFGKNTVSAEELQMKPELKEQFINHIVEHQHWSMDKDLHFQNFNEYAKGACNFFDMYPQDAAEPKCTIIPGVLEFDRDDFGIVKGTYGYEVWDSTKFQDGKPNNSLTVLGWHAKRGTLLSDVSDNVFKDPIYKIQSITIETRDSATVKPVIDSSATEVSTPTTTEEKPVIETVLDTDALSIFDDSKTPENTTENDTYIDPYANEMYGDIFGTVFKKATGFVKTKLNKKKAAKWLVRTLGLTGDAVKFTKELTYAAAAGGNVWGCMTQDAITLYEGAESGVEYHEAFHRVSLLLLSNEERNALYKEYKNRANTTEDDVTIEETLADEFMEYMASPMRRIKYEVARIFAKMRDFVMHTRKFDSGSIQEVFRNINKGVFKNAVEKEESVKRFLDIYKNAALATAPGIRSKLDITHSEYDGIVNTLKNVLLSLNGITRVEQIKDINPAVLKKWIETRAKDEKLLESVRNTYAVLNEFFDSELYPNIRRALASVDINVRPGEESTYILETEQGIKVETKPAYESDKFTAMASNVKLFLANIPEVEVAMRELNGTVTQCLVPRINKHLGMPTIMPARLAYNKSIKVLCKANTFEDMLNICEKEGAHDMFFKVLRSKLLSVQADANSKDSVKKVTAENFKTQLLVAMNSNLHEFTFVKYRFTPKEEGSTELISDFVVGESNILKTSRLYQAQWNEAFLNGGLVPEGKVKRAAIKEISKEYDTITNEFKEKVVNKTVTDTDTAALKQNILDLFRKIGITIDMQVLNRFIDNESDKIKGTKTANEKLVHILTSQYAGSMSYLLGSSNSLLSSIASGNTLSYTERGKKVSKGLNEVFKAEAIVKTLSEINAKINPREDSLSVLGAENTILYPVSQHCYASDMVGWLKNDTALLDNLLNVTYNKSSILLNSLKNKVNINLKTFNTFAEDSVGDKGRKYTSVSDVEDFMIKLTFLESKHMLFPTMADKTTYFTIDGLTLPIGDSTFELANNAMSYNMKFNTDTITQLRAYFVDELNTILAYWSDEHQDVINKNQKRRVVNYHTKHMGGKFRHFDKLVMRGTDNKRVFVDLNELIMEGVDAKNPNVIAVRANLARIQDMLFGKKDENGTYVDAASKFADTINASLYNRLLGDLEYAEEIGVVEKDIDGKYRNLLLPGTVLNEAIIKIQTANPTLSTNAIEDFAIRSIIGKFTTGTMLSVIDFEKTFTKDPAFYKNPDDKIKRITSVLSTGDHVNKEGSYTCATCKDNMLKEDQYDELLTAFTEANLRDALLEDVDAGFTEANVDEFMELSDEEKVAKYPNYNIVKAAMEASSTIDMGSYADGRVNQTDATVIIGPRMYMGIVKGLGEWSPEVEEAFNLMESGREFLDDPKLYQKSLRTLIKPLKTMSFGDNFDTELGLDIPVFNKMAMFPLFKVLAKGDISVLYDRMNKEGDIVDMIAFESAVKVGAKDDFEFYSDSSNTAINDLTDIPVYTQEYRFLRRQLVTDPHHSERIMLGTQVAKAALSNLVDDRDYDGMTGAQIRTEVFNAMNTLSDIGKKEYLNSLLNEDATGIDIDKLSKMLIEKAHSDNMSQDVIDGLQVVDGKFKVPLAASSASKWVSSMVITELNKKAVDIHLPGGAFIQKSSFAQKSITKLSDTTYGKGEYLKFNKEDGSMECEISINMLSHVIPNYNKMSFTEAREYLIKNNIIGNDANPHSIGYRIPTQGPSSIVSLTIKDVLPSNIGDTIILPDSFTALTGSDFDVDKLYVVRHNFETVEDENGNKITRKVEYVDGDDNSKEAIENHLIDMYTKVLTNRKSIVQLKASLDNTTNKLKGPDGPLQFVDNATKKDVQECFKYISPSFQANKKREYGGGKDGISPYALSNVHHVLTQLMKLTYKKYSDDSGEFIGALKKYGFGRLDKIKGKDGIRVLDWLSAMINAHVDVAKDPYIIRLGVSEATHTMNNFLLRCGIGDAAFYFFPQPILKEMVTEVNKLKGTYGVDKSKPQFKAVQDAKSQIRKKYEQLLISALIDEQRGVFGKLTTKDGSPVNAYQFKYFLESNKAVQGAAYDKYRDLFTYDTEDLSLYGDDKVFDKEFLKKQITESVKESGSKADFYFNQLAILNAYEELEPFAKDLSTLVRLSQVDTKKFGNTFALQDRFIYRLKRFVTSTKTFETDDLRRFFSDTFLDTKLRNSAILARQMFKGTLLEATDKFVNTVDEILGLIGELNTSNEDTIKSVANCIEADIRGQFFINRMRTEAIAGDVYSNPLGLLYNRDSVGTKSMANRLQAFKMDIVAGKYPSLLDADGNITNEFINHLQPQSATTFDSWGKPDIISRPTLVGTDADMDQRMKDYWEELLNSNDPTIRKIAEDLVNYAYITSGGNMRKNSIFHLIPESYLRKIGYHKFMEEATNYMVHGVNIEGTSLDDIFVNNWHNSALVSEIKIKVGDDILPNIRSTEVIPGTEIQYPTIVVDTQSTQIGISVSKEPLFKRYVKINLDRTKNPATTLLYKLVGYTTFDKKPAPVYALVTKKGMNTDGAYFVEYSDIKLSQCPFNNIPGKVLPTIVNGGLTQDYVEDLKKIATSDMSDALLSYVSYTSQQLNDPFSNTTYDEVMSNGNNTIRNYQDKLSGIEDGYLTEKETVNVYAGDNENANLSNFAIRPFTHTVNGTEINFKSVEQAFQYCKISLAKESKERNEVMQQILATTNGGTLKALGKRVRLDTKMVKTWNSVKTDAMYRFIAKSFANNPEFIDELLATGNATITHISSNPNVAKDEYTTLFPKVLMRVRFDLQHTNVGAPVGKLENVLVTGKGYVYTKHTAPSNKDTNFVFTENLQADDAKRNIFSAGTDDVTELKIVKLNVVGGTNQAGIRTTLTGDIAPNSYGLIVKRYQQSTDGKFVTQEGTFKDNDTEFEMFCKRNNIMFNELLASGKPTVFPSGIAMGKSALPERFAEWLQTSLKDLAGLNYKIVPREDGKYKGFGLQIVTTEDTDVLNNVNNTAGTNNDETNFNDQATSLQVLNSDNNIMSEDEVAYLRKKTTTEEMTDEFNKSYKSKFKIAVASEHTDPAFFANKIISMLDGKTPIQNKYGAAPKAEDIKALYIITKHDGIPIKKLLDYDIPKIIHFSITTLAGTKYEPGVMKADDLLDKIESYIKLGLDPEGITLRVDPIIPFVTKIDDVEHIIKRASGMGIKKVRFSVLDYYSTTAQFMESLGYDYSKAYNKDKTGRYYMHAKQEIIDGIIDKMAAFKDKYGVILSTCAEPTTTDKVSKEACLSVAAVNNMLGTSVKDDAIGKQRKLCSCFGGKSDLLQYNNDCLSACAYCYAHHNNDKQINYYNEDGSLKDNHFTRTSEEKVAEVATQPTTLNPKEVSLHSGGAYGGDSLFNAFATEYHIPNKLHYRPDNTDWLAKSIMGNIDSYGKYTGGTPVTIDYINLNENARKFIQDYTNLSNPDYLELHDYNDILKICRRFYATIGVHLKDDYIDNLKARDLIQVISSDAVYAIAPINAKNNGVTGGTNYAVMAAKYLSKPVYVLDPSNPTTWQKWDGSKFKACATPTLTKDFAGIGSRQIESYYNWKTKSMTTVPYTKSQMEQVKSKVTELFENTFNPNIQGKKQEVATQGTLFNYDAKVVEKPVTISQDSEEAPQVFKNQEYKEVVYNNNTFKVFPDGTITDKKGRPKYYTTDPGTIKSANMIRQMAYPTEAPVATPTKVTTAREAGNYLTLGEGRNKVDINLTKLGINFQLNDGQLKALNSINNRLRDVDRGRAKPFTLSGAAGTGKSTITKIIINMFETKLPYSKYVAAAPTHAAKQVIADITGKQAMTVAAMIGLSPNMAIDDLKPSDLEFRTIDTPLMKKKPALIIVDECSMLNEVSVDEVLKAADQISASVLFIGDKAQLEPVKESDISKSFRLEDSAGMVALTKVERQTGGNPLLPKLDAIRAAQDENGKIGISGIQTSFDEYGRGVVNVPGNNFKLCMDIAAEYYKSPIYKNDINYFKILAYKNDEIAAANKHIAEALGFTTLQPGEPLLTYKAVSAKGIVEVTKEDGTKIKKLENVTIQNGTEMRIDTISENSEFVITDEFEFRDKTKVFKFNTTAVDMGECTFEIIQNFTHTEKQHFIEYIKFVEAEHAEVMDCLKTIQKQMFDKSNPSKTVRLSDSQKELLNYKYDTVVYKNVMEFKIAENQSYFDKYERLMTMEDIYDDAGKLIKKKSVSRGYARTIHKSQGATFKNVMLIEDGLLKTAKVRDKVYHPNGTVSEVENKIKTNLTKLKLYYVAASRPTTTLFIAKSQSNDISDFVKYGEVLAKRDSEFSNEQEIKCKS